MLNWPMIWGPIVDPSEYDRCPTPPDWEEEDSYNDGDIPVAESPLKKAKTDAGDEEDTGGDDSEDDSEKIFDNEEERKRFWVYHAMVFKYQCVGKVYPIDLHSKDADEYYTTGVPIAARLAIDFYNAKADDKKQKLEYVGIKKANHKTNELFITFKAKVIDSSSEELQTFQTAVWYNTNRPCEVRFVRPEPRHHKIKGEDDWLFCLA
ncbi:uncharacterized protein LOC126680873 [Mercurialis annua]|uniref:uncharacterized protein LOC126680873 n=1 Tax=Mercurialis annua TaxID=3986 RepID=UPI0021603F5F|nr:uncharacterized protein LOC126680873 [Mercurialis annua]